MDQSEAYARGLEDRLGAKRYMAMDWASCEFFSQENKFLTALQAKSRFNRQGKSIFAGASKENIAEVMRELARPSPLVKYKLVNDFKELDWQEDRPFRDLLLLCC